MNSAFENLRAFLHARGVRALGAAPEVVPAAEAAWRYVAGLGVQVTERVPGEALADLERAFHRLTEKTHILRDMPVLLSVSDLGGPWIRIILNDTKSVVQRLSFRTGEPSFILASESRRSLLAVDTEEWEHLLISAQWQNDGTITPYLLSES